MSPHKEGKYGVHMTDEERELLSQQVRACAGGPPEAAACIGRSG
jgi:hypothetical protein